MEIKERWQEIKAVFEAASLSSLHVSMATVNEAGEPHMAPIGSLILGENCDGYYLEEFPVRLSRDLDRKSPVSVLAVNSDLNFWMTSLTEGKFKSYPGFRLTGRSLGRRRATAEEVETWHQRVRFAEGLKGHDIMWKNMKTVRLLKFESCCPVLCGEMTAHLL